MSKNNNWNDLNWRKIYAFVKILQSELVVAYKNKDQVKVHFIQEKLGMSFEARSVAVKRVTVNDSKKTPGFDNIGVSKEILLFDITQAKQIKINSLKNNINPYTDKEYYTSRSLIVDVERFRKAIYKKYSFRCYLGRKIFICIISFHEKMEVNIP